MRVGIGYDIHKFIKNRDLIIGGVKIAYEYGLLGHSDSDVLTHAIIDALLGSLSLRDIGTHFRDDDNKYKGISSIELLKYVNNLIEDNNYKVINIDSIIITEAPKMYPYIDLMINNIANILRIDKNKISIKAKTNEGLGVIGNKEGIAAYAICMLG